MKLWLLIIGTSFCGIVSAQSGGPTIQFAKSWNCPGVVSAEFLELFPNNQFIFGGNVGDVQNARLTVFKTDSVGRTFWIKNYTSLDNGGNWLGKVRPDASGNYLASVSGDNIMMVDTAGNLLKAVRLNTQFGDPVIVDVRCMPNGDKIVSYQVPTSANGVGFWGLACVSADLSTVLWNTIIDQPAYLPKMKIDGDTILCAGFYTNNGGALGLLMSFHSSNGQFIRKFTFRIENEIVVATNISPYNDGYIAMATSGTGTSYNHVILRLNKNFQVLNTYEIQGPAFYQNLEPATEPNGNFFALAGDTTGIPIVFSISSTDSILWARRNIAMPVSSPAYLLKTADGLVAFTYNDHWGAGPYTFYGLVKTDANGYSRSCTYDDYPLQKIKVNVVDTVANIIIEDTNILTLSKATIIQESITYPDSPLCFAISSCSSVKILGENVNCSTDTGTFTANRNAGCFAPIKWTISGGPTQQQEWNDSTIHIKFLQPGQYKLKAAIESSHLADSVDINIDATGFPLNLGTDTVICRGSTVTLNAHSGFASYQWQDGSTDSIYLVTQPGTYHVTITDLCGNIYNDTVVVAPHPPIQFSAGPDRIKCNNDTLHLEASAGFLNYAWSNNYHISSLSNETVIVFPDVDTSYFVKAEKTPGCFAFDTVHVTVYRSPQIFLGADTSFCSGDSIVLKTPVGFTSYQWNTGSTAPQIVVKSPGSYNVNATSSNGCDSRDTLQVINVWKNPVVSLDKSPGLCFQSTRTLDAGAFQSYLWQDGSSSRTFGVTHLGEYYVQVIDGNQCKGSDTANIKYLLPVPANFLPPDTTLCTYAVLDVSSKLNFRSYLWSNGSTGKSISISNSGSYWLQVRDYYNCIGKDTINISPKACAKGVFIPTAFTPDHNGKDDVFRALVNGPIKSFELLVYNRWGQLVFHTKQSSQGWDGTVAGHASDIGTYVWICRYQFEGDPVKLDKGMVVLIR